MYECSWHVDAEQIDPYKYPSSWKVSIYLSMDEDFSCLTTMFSINVHPAHSKEEAITLAFDTLDERNLSDES